MISPALLLRALPSVTNLLASQTIMLPIDVAVSAREQLRRKMVWLNLPTGLLKSSSVRGGA